MNLYGLVVLRNLVNDESGSTALRRNMRIDIIIAVTLIEGVTILCVIAGADEE